MDERRKFIDGNGKPGRLISFSVVKSEHGFYDEKVLWLEYEDGSVGAWLSSQIKEVSNGDD